MNDQFKIINGALGLYDGIKLDIASFSALSEAISFASIAHDKQYRKDGITPYITHPLRVQVFIYSYITKDITTNQIAILHDVIEDTKYGYSDILDRFGSKVADGVLSLTKDSSLSKEDRKNQMLENCFKASNSSKIVKAADRIDNLSSAPYAFTRRGLLYYIEEAYELYNVLVKSPNIHQSHNGDWGCKLSNQVIKSNEYLKRTIDFVKENFGE